MLLSPSKTMLDFVGAAGIVNIIGYYKLLDIGSKKYTKQSGSASSRKIFLVYKGS